MRKRLHPTDSPDYQVARSNSEWPEHVLRANITGAMIASLTPSSIIDPACGDGSVILAAHKIYPILRAVLSDVSAPNMLGLQTCVDAHLTPYQTELATLSIEQILTRKVPYDVIVLTEILEHLPDPDTILRLARKRARSLVASSPEMRPGQEDWNPEHLWQFDGEGYEQMLVEAGWRAIQKTHLTFRTTYNFQIWIAE